MDPMNNKIRVAVVDDHPIFRAGLAQVLRSRDIDVIAEGQSGADALAICRSDAPQIILVDISMSDDGISAAAAIKSEYPDTKVIMLTVSEHDDDVFRALEAGADGYLLKGLAGQELQDKIRRVAAGERVIATDLSTKVLANMAKVGGKRSVDRLSPQETRTLELVALGLSNVECARRMNISEQAIKFHMTRLMKKLGVRNRVEAALVANEAWSKNRSKS